MDILGSATALTALPLDPISPRLPITDPFTPAMAARAGIGRAVLDRLHRDGRVRRVLRGVYLDATVPLTLEVRARALALVVGPGQVAVGITAAWLHGVALPVLLAGVPTPVEVPVELHGRGRGAAGRRGRASTYADRDVLTVQGITCTTPLRTALDLGRQLAPGRALAVLDSLLRLGLFPHTALMAELPRFSGRPGSVQLRELAALADGRADGAAESVLRLRWLEGRLPTPTPGLMVRVPGSAPVRLSLGLELHRFGVVLAGRLDDAGMAAASAQGWRVVVLSPGRVLRSDPGLLAGHLEREFHRHLLDQWDECAGRG
jgi:hypothetical protein